jgi:hypothetical protein
MLKNILFLFKKIINFFYEKFKYLETNYNWIDYKK